MKTVAITHVGKVRSVNEDKVLIACDNKPYFLIVADGMGGHVAGEIASKIACNSVNEYLEQLNTTDLSEEQITNAILYANEQILEEITKDETLHGMGTTITFAYINGKDITIAHVGDSRAYLLSENAIIKLTKDHTYIQQLVDHGIIKKENQGEYPFKNIITRALGMKDLKVDIYYANWQAGDYLLLCSDGLTNYATKKVIEDVLVADTKLTDKAQSLVDFALNGGGKDNISVVIAQNISGSGK